MVRRLLLALILSVLFTSSLHARERLLMDGNWTFHLGEAPDLVPADFAYPEVVDLAKASIDDPANHTIDDARVEAHYARLRKDPVATNLGSTVSFVQPGFDDSGWRKLTLPHDWVVGLPFSNLVDKCLGNEANPSSQDPAIRNAIGHGFKDISATSNNIGWYRKSFDLTADDKGKSIWIEFDGVFRNSIVWLNGHCLGRNVSGYSSFKYDIASAANIGGKNELVVRVDASRVEGWFYEGAGIYRHVWLVKTAPVHIAHWGTRVISTVAANGSATVTLETTLQNDTADDAVVDLQSALQPFKPGEATVDQGLLVSPKTTVPAGQTTITTQTFNVGHPALWSCDFPNLYLLRTQVMQGGAAIDDLDTRFGIRTVVFDVNTGMYLNGQHVFIKGTSNHQDHAGVGAALPDRLQYYRLEQLKKLGCNAYRTTHNPPTPELLDACDEMGILVMDEHRESGRTPEILDQLRRLITRDRNHPSVILWSIGNEENNLEGNDGVGETVARIMMNAVRQLDTTRPITAAMNKGWGKGFSRVLDVEGFNYPKNTSTDRYHVKHPRQPLFASEEGSTVSTRGIYENDPKLGYVSAYDINAPKWATLGQAWWSTYKREPYMAGAFVWTGFDYRGEPTPYESPCVSSHFGMLDTCGFFKDEAYFYQSIWTDKPMVHLLPHWNWAGKEGQPITVWAYSNCDEVELTANGNLLGKQAFPAGGHLEWKIPYAPGSLKAVAYRDGEAVASDTVETTGAPSKIALTPDRAVLNADGEDIAMITVAITDDTGRTVPIASNLVNFSIEGGSIIGVGNGDPSCHEADKAMQRSAFNGLCMVIVQTTTTAGNIKLTATSPGLSPVTVVIETKPAVSRLKI